MYSIDKWCKQLYNITVTFNRAERIFSAKEIKL